MGNSTSSTTNSRNSAGISASRVEEADAEPLIITESQVNHVFAAMKVTFDRTTQELDDVEKGLLLSKHCFKFQEEYPSVIMAEVEGVVGSSPSPTPTLPFEILVPHVACFLPRSDLNNLKVTCQQMKQTIDNNPELLATLPWGTICPFQFPPPNEIDCPLGGVIFSDDGSLVAVFTEGTIMGGGVPGSLQVWDRRMGLLGELECSPALWYKPVFSPDNQLLLLPPRNGDGIRACMLSNGEEQVSFTVSSHDLNGALVRSVAFLDNTTIAFMVLVENGVKTCNVTRDNDQITLTEAVQTTLVDPVHSGVIGRHWRGSLASFAGANKDILAYVYDFRDRFICFYDLRTSTSVRRPIPDDSSGVNDLAFSHDGNRLVVGHHEGASLSVFDCNVDSIADIGEPRAIFLDGSYYYRDISFSPRSASKISVACFDRNTSMAWTRIRIIDIENNQTLCDGWNDSSWKMLID